MGAYRCIPSIIFLVIKARCTASKQKEGLLVACLVSNSRTWLGFYIEALLAIIVDIEALLVIIVYVKIAIFTQFMRSDLLNLKIDILKKNKNVPETCAVIW